MPIRALNEVLEEAVGCYVYQNFEFEAGSEDADLTVKYVAAPSQSVCECDHGLVVESVYRVALWLGRRDGGEYSVMGTVPLELVMDGDCNPLMMLVEELSERAKFGLVMDETGEPVDQDAEISDDDGA